MITESFIVADVFNKSTLPANRWTNNWEDTNHVTFTTARLSVQHEVQDRFHLHLAAKYAIS
jgi:hypothetical protein